jgi:hypothetical protein
MTQQRFWQDKECADGTDRPPDMREFIKERPGAVCVDGQGIVSFSG